MRLFFALWPPPAAARALHAWALQAQRSTGGRVIGAGTIHLTLAFLGETDPSRVAAVAAAARRVRAATGMLRVDQAAYWRHNRIVWAGPKETDTALADALALELRAAGFALEERAFKAHVTLIRQSGAGELPPLPTVRWPVNSFVLVCSELAGAGSRYRVLQEFALQP